jgi:phenylacetate-CoA ligase
MATLGLRRAISRAAWHVHPAPRGRVYRYLQASQWLSPEELRRVQLDALNRVLDAARGIAFYRERLERASIGARGVSSLEELARLEPLERSELQQLGIDGLRGPGVVCLRRQTSGSTGQPVEVRWSREMMAWVDATNRRSLEWVGVDRGNRTLIVRASTSKLRGVRSLVFNGARVFPGRLFEPEYRERAISAIKRRPPSLVLGNAKPTYTLALALEDVAPVKAGVVVTGAAALHEHYREAIERVFDCRAYNRYGAIETGQIAHPCREAGLRHLASETILLEVVREDGSPADPGELGEVLVTTLRNRAMPLLRYRLGDFAAVAADVCPCGRGLPVLERVIGRSNEVLVDARGQILVPDVVVDDLMEVAGSSLLEFKVVQARDLSVEVLVVQRDEPEAEDVQRRLAAAFDRLIGVPGKTVVTRVPDIPLARGEKLQVIVSHAVHGQAGVEAPEEVEKAVRGALASS